MLITGGARGVGAATASRLVERGARVVLVDIDEDPLIELVERLGPERATWITGDVTDLAAMQAAVARAIWNFGPVDVVVANAGIASYGSVATVDPAIFRRVIDINITGVFHIVRAALPALIQQSGYVLVVSSAAAYAPAPGLAAYNASKAGAEHFANALRMELGYRGVAVGSAHMSWIDTPMVQDAKRDLTAFGEHAGIPAGAAGSHDLGRAVRRGVRARHREPSKPHQRARLGGDAALDQAGAQHKARRAPEQTRDQTAPPAHGRRGRSPRTISQLTRGAPGRRGERERRGPGADLTLLGRLTCFASSIAVRVRPIPSRPSALGAELVISGSGAAGTAISSRQDRRSRRGPCGAARDERPGVPVRGAAMLTRGRRPNRRLPRIVVRAPRGRNRGQARGGCRCANEVDRQPEVDALPTAPDTTVATRRSRRGVSGRNIGAGRPGPFLSGRLG